MERIEISASLSDRCKLNFLHCASIMRCTNPQFCGYSNGFMSSIFTFQGYKKFGQKETRAVEHIHQSECILWIRILISKKIDSFSLKWDFKIYTGRLKTITFHKEKQVSWKSIYLAEGMERLVSCSKDTDRNSSIGISSAEAFKSTPLKASRWFVWSWLWMDAHGRFRLNA